MATSTLIVDYLGANLAVSRPTTPNVPPGGTAIYYATDTGAISVWTGSAWTTIGVISNIASNNILANITGGSAAPIGNTLTAVMDAVFGNTRGEVLYRGATGWAALAPGTAGNVLTAGGAGADPAWAAGGAGGSSSVMWCDSLSGFTASANATLGVYVKPIENFAISELFATMNITSTMVFFAGVYQVNGSNVITAVTATGAPVTPGVTAPGTFKFPLVASFVAGNTYAICLTRTDGTASSNLPISSSSVNGDQMAFRGAPIQYQVSGGNNSTSVVLNSLLPALTNTFTTFGGALGMGIK